MKHLKVYEDLSMGDPTYGNSVFKISYRSVNDLSNKKGSDIIDKPINDLLDGIEVGDAITGLGAHDEKPHTGNVVAIKKDEKGEDLKTDKKEEKPKDKKVTIMIMNLDGDTLRTLKHEPDSGVNIVSWNFDTKGIYFPQRRERKKEDDERGGGITKRFILSMNLRIR